MHESPRDEIYSRQADQAQSQGDQHLCERFRAAHQLADVRNGHLKRNAWVEEVNVESIAGQERGRVREREMIVALEATVHRSEEKQDVDDEERWKGQRAEEARMGDEGILS